MLPRCDTFQINNVIIMLINDHYIIPAGFQFGVIQRSMLCSILAYHGETIACLNIAWIVSYLKRQSKHALSDCTSTWDLYYNIFNMLDRLQFSY